MDDEYDFDEDLDRYSDREFELDDYMDEDEDDGSVNELSDSEVEIAGSLDGEFDAESGAPMYSGYGASVDFEELSDEQKDLYDNAYNAGHDMAK